MIKGLILFLGLAFANLVVSYSYQSGDSYFSNEAASSPLASSASLPYLAPPPAPAPEPAGSGPDLDALYGPPVPYSFSHSGGGSTRSETSNGRSVTGSYSLHGADGIMRVVHYVADGDGFRASVITNEPGTEKSQPAGVLMESSATPAKELSEKFTATATASDKSSPQASTFVNPSAAWFASYPSSKVNSNAQKQMNIPSFGKSREPSLSSKSPSTASRYSSVKSPVQAAKGYRYTPQKVSAPVEVSLPPQPAPIQHYQPVQQFEPVKTTYSSAPSLPPQPAPIQPIQQFEPVKTAYPSAPSLPPQPAPIQPIQQFEPVKTAYPSAPSLPPQPAPIQPIQQFEPVKTAYPSAPSLPPQPAPIQPIQQFEPVKTAYPSAPSLPPQPAPIQNFEPVKPKYTSSAQTKGSKVSTPLVQQTYKSPIQQQAQRQTKEQTHFSFQSQVNHLQPVQPQQLQPQSVEPQSVEPQSVEPQSVEPQSVEPQAIQPVQQQYAIAPQAPVKGPAPAEYYQTSPRALAEATSEAPPVTTFNPHFGVKGFVPTKQHIKSPSSTTQKEVVAQIPQLGRKTFRSPAPFSNAGYKRPVDAYRFKPSGPVKSQVLHTANQNPQEKIQQAKDGVDHVTQDQNSHDSIVQDRIDEPQADDQGF